MESGMFSNVSWSCKLRTFRLRSLLKSDVTSCRPSCHGSSTLFERFMASFESKIPMSIPSNTCHSRFGYHCSIFLFPFLCHPFTASVTVSVQAGPPSWAAFLGQTRCPYCRANSNATKSHIGTVNTQCMSSS